MQKTCPVCGEAFATTHRSQNYCSKKCAARGPRVFDIAQVASMGGRSRRGSTQTAEHVQKRAASLAATLAKTVRKCPECGADFTPRNAPQRYCSGSCSDAVRRRKAYVASGGARGRKNRVTLTAEERSALLEEQGGACAICQGTNGTQRLGVDHDHETGRVRGLLCHRCNTAIGLLQDSTPYLRAAIDYLLKYR